MSIDLQALLTKADRRTLAAVVTHLSGDPKAVPDLKDRAQIEATAMRIIPPYMRGEKQVMPPSDAVLQAAMNLCTGEMVPPEYAPMAREQMAIGPVVKPKPLNPPAGFNVVIIGAGVTGVFAGLMLDQLGLSSYTIYDKNPMPGGTWWLNQYPGCRVDTPSLLYSYSFAMDRGWPEHFSHQPDLLKYVNDIAEGHRFGERLQCNTSVETMTWNDATAKWDLDIVRGDGKKERVSTNFVIGATGLLRVPQMPPIAGIEDFKGPWFHSTAWRKDIDLKGKRIAIIGTGASANQIVPQIAKTADEVIIFQRTPHWMMSHPKYGKALSGDERDLIEQIPTYLSWFRFLQFWQNGDSILSAVRIDPAWPNQRRSVSAVNERLREEMMAYITAQIGDRPDLMQKVVPDYPPHGKRLLLDNGWYQALRRDNVRLIATPIKCITADGVLTGDGLEKVDVIAYATGFDTNKIMWPIQINGRGGMNVRKELDEKLEAYHGTALAHCPNLLITWGPNGVPGHGGNGIFFAETQIHYITECLRAMFDNGWKKMEVREDALRKNVDAVQKELKQFVWSMPDISNWHKGKRDRVTSVTPKRLIDIWKDSKAPVTADYSVG